MMVDTLSSSRVAGLWCSHTNLSPSPPPVFPTCQQDLFLTLKPCVSLTLDRELLPPGLSKIFVQLLKLKENTVEKQPSKHTVHKQYPLPLSIIAVRKKGKYIKLSRKMVLPRSKECEMLVFIKTASINHFCAFGGM